MRPIKYDNDILLRQETQKRLHVLDADIITIKKYIHFMSLAQWMHFLEDVFQKTAIALVLVINHLGGAPGVMVIVVGNGHSDTSSNPGRDWLHFT